MERSRTFFGCPGERINVFTMLSERMPASLKMCIRDRVRHLRCGQVLIHQNKVGGGHAKVLAQLVGCLLYTSGQRHGDLEGGDAVCQRQSVVALNEVVGAVIDARTGHRCV